VERKKMDEPEIEEVKKKDNFTSKKETHRSNEEQRSCP
jgi:hypothetical protein